MWRRREEGWAAGMWWGCTLQWQGARLSCWPMLYIGEGPSGHRNSVAAHVRGSMLVFALRCECGLAVIAVHRRC